MGLDMYLTGESFYCHGHPNRNLQPYPIERTHYALGYWRKHPNLHGYIVETFADGVDKCQVIDLSADAIQQILAAIKNRQLPPTEGFFFGKSEDTEAQIAEDVAIFEAAHQWLEDKVPGEWRSVRYQASW